jgi:hypothetical protein
MKNNKIEKVTNLLEQIEQLNSMIDLHNLNPTPSGLMLEQYEMMRQDFLEELQDALRSFHIGVHIIEKIA